MERKHYNMIVIGCFAAFTLFFIAFRLINSSLEDKVTTQIQIKQNEQQVDYTSNRAIENQSPDVLGVNDWEQYQIVPQKQNVLLKGQRYWDLTMNRSLRKSDVIGRMQTLDTFKGAKKTPEEFQARLERINGRIREYERKVNSNPGDEYAQRKLSDLYMIKSSLNALEKTVVTSDLNENSY